MTDNKLNTALILFSRTATEEAKTKNFYSKAGRKANKLVAEKLIGHATKLARKAGVDFFIFTEKEQSQGDFGIRLSNAFSEVFNKGYESVISIGNDCPSLDANTISQAIDALQSNKVVIGPSTDGGVYLLGLQRENFDIRKFRELKWKTTELTEDIINTCRKEGDLHILPTLTDIDHEQDLHLFLQFNTSELVGYLKSLLISFQSQWYGTHINSYVGRLMDLAASRRGPPTSLH